MSAIQAIDTVESASKKPLLVNNQTNVPINKEASTKPNAPKERKVDLINIVHPIINSTPAKACSAPNVELAPFIDSLSQW
jgi:hypothetical protein